MKKFIAIIAVAMMFVATSCGNKANQVEAVEDSVETVDSVAVDTVAVVDSVVAE